jgi:hypothetical protein
MKSPSATSSRSTFNSEAHPSNPRIRTIIVVHTPPQLVDPTEEQVLAQCGEESCLLGYSFDGSIVRPVDVLGEQELCLKVVESGAPEVC